MVSAVHPLKGDPRAVAAGKRGAELRWSDPAVRTTVRIDDLTLEQRRLVLALVDAAKKAPAAAESASAQEVDRNGRDHTTAA